MHNRDELERDRTLEEMRAVIDTFATDKVEYPDKVVRLREGISKVVAEEYVPLFLLAQTLPGFASAKLTGDSHPGPDAILQFDDDTEATVQITCAGEDYQAALKRELLANHRAVFQHQMARRLPDSAEIEQTGRAWTTRVAATRAFVQEVLAAIEKKTKKYRAGTQILLVSAVSTSPLTLTPDWRATLLAAVAATGELPYAKVYVVNSHTCVQVR